MDESINAKIIPSEKLAYWIGVAQADGHLRVRKRKNNVYYSVEFGISKKSLPMLSKFHRISSELLNKDSEKPPHKYRNIWSYCVGITRFFSELKKLDIKFGDPPIPPIWSIKNAKFLGAYLAGVIDGDGNIRIKRPKYPQYAIRIICGSPQTKLRSVVESKLNCKALITKVYRKHYFTKEKRFIEGIAYELEFLVSSKNMNFVKEFVLPHINIGYKKAKLESYIVLRSSKQ